jgi:hypothetical protein
MAASLPQRLRPVFVLALIAMCLITVPHVEASKDESSDAPGSVELAQAFTAALNAHDVDAVVGMFTDENSGPTVTADRYAWQKFEIRLWAQRQVAAGIRTEAFDYTASEHGATWGANVYRDDFSALGVEFVPVTNTIWVHNGKLADFTSTLNEPRDFERLGVLWQPGSVPEPLPRV